VPLCSSRHTREPRRFGRRRAAVGAQRGAQGWMAAAERHEATVRSHRLGGEGGWGLRDVCQQRGRQRWERRRRRDVLLVHDDVLGPAPRRPLSRNNTPQRVGQSRTTRAAVKCSALSMRTNRTPPQARVARYSPMDATFFPSLNISIFFPLTVEDFT